jgi:hypothetical protein
VNAARIAGRYDERRRGLGVGQRARSSAATRGSGRRHTTGISRRAGGASFQTARILRKPSGPSSEAYGFLSGSVHEGRCTRRCTDGASARCVTPRGSGLSGGSPRGAQRVRDEDVDGGHSRSQSSGTWFYGIVLARGEWRSDEIFGSDRGAQPGTRQCLPAPSGSAARLEFERNSSEVCASRDTHAKDGRVGDAWARSLQ